MFYKRESRHERTRRLNAQEQDILKRYFLVRKARRKLPAYFQKEYQLAKHKGVPTCFSPLLSQEMYNVLSYGKIKL